MTSLDALRRFNTEAPEAPGETLAFQMPERVPWVMSFDQSLLHTGMVVLHGRGTVEATTLRPPPGMARSPTSSTPTPWRTGWSGPSPTGSPR